MQANPAARPCQDGMAWTPDPRRSWVIAVIRTDLGSLGRPSSASSRLLGALPALAIEEVLQRGAEYGLLEVGAGRRELGEQKAVDQVQQQLRLDLRLRRAGAL